MDFTNPITKITGLSYGDLARMAHDLDEEINSDGFNRRLFAYRVNIRRFRIALNQLAAAMRGIDDGENYSYLAVHDMPKIFVDPRTEPFG